MTAFLFFALPATLIHESNIRRPWVRSSPTRRRSVLALFIADVSHTANSNTQLMLLYETNERTNERKI